MSLFQTPAIRSEHLSPEEWQYKLDQMHRRACATQQWQMGQLTPGDLEQALRENGLADPRILHEFWSRGISHPGV